MNQQTLLTALQQVAPVADDKSTMPIVGCVLFKNGRVTATDTVQRVATSLDCDLSNVAIPAKKMLTIVRSAPKSADINIEQKDNAVTVKFGRSRYTIPTLPGDDFPDPPEVDALAEFGILDSVLSEAAQSVVRQAGKDDVRYFLNGALLTITDGTMTMVGTNGHKMAAWSGDVEADDVQVILSRVALDHLARIKPTGDNVHVKVTAVESVFMFRDRMYAARLIDGKYPDWQRVVPEGGEPVTFKRDDMLDACKRANALFQDVRFSFSGESCEISAESRDGERAIDEIDAQGGQGVTVSFNAQYMVEALETLDGDVTMRVKDETSAAVLTDDEGGLRQVVMPVRV